MGFFSQLFGGDDDKAAKWQREDNREMLEYTKQMAALARSDVDRNFEEGRESRQLGAQRALDIFANVMPQRMGLVQQGRQRTQDTLLGGSELYKRALLGLPADTSILQKGPMDVDMSWAQQTLPALEIAAQAEQQQDPGYDNSEFPLNPTYADPNANSSPEVMSAYDAGASAQASAGDLAAFNMGVSDADGDGLISDAEFRAWPGYDQWLAQNPNHPRGPNKPGSQPGSRFTGRYDASGNPIYINPTEMRGQNASQYATGVPQFDIAALLSGRGVL